MDVVIYSQPDTKRLLHKIMMVMLLTGTEISAFCCNNNLTNSKWFVAIAYPNGVFVMNISIINVSKI